MLLWRIRRSDCLVGLCTLVEKAQPVSVGMVVSLLLLADNTAADKPTDAKKMVNVSIATGPTFSPHRKRYKKGMARPSAGC